MTGSNPLLVFTGGHHTSALAVAKNLKKRSISIIWLGHKYSMQNDRHTSAEFREVSESGIPFIELIAGKLYGNFNLSGLIKIILGFIQSLIILIYFKFFSKYRLKGIVTFGGYLGVPVVLAGKFLGIPVIVHEQTVTSGWANKLISKFAKKIAVSWPSSLVNYPASRSVLTGLPLRPEIIKIKKKSIVRNSHLIYVTGGKQGSHIINQVIFDTLPQLLTNYTIVHQTGNNSVHKDFEKALAINRPEYKVFDYLKAADAAGYLASAEIVISRSGAHIIQELAYFNTKSVLIPIPDSSHNEQLKNAQLLELHNLAVVVPQHTLSPETLLAAITRLKLLKTQPLNLIENGLENMTQLIIDTLNL